MEAPVPGVIVRHYLEVYFQKNPTSLRRLVIDHEFRRNIVKVAVDPRGGCRSTPLSTSP